MKKSATKSGGDLVAFMENRGELLSVARSVVNDPTLAEELVQESWFRWSGRGYPKSDARPILKRIVTNLARDFLRRRRTETTIVDTLALGHEAAPNIEDIVVARDQIAKVREVLNEMPERTKIAFEMSCFEGFTYAEIAEKLNISRPRAHQLVRHALTKITVRLGK
ncbi:MAG: sigma-70 family RNA polymerase sigma factor [Pseudomonadota bacterium]